MTDLNIDLYRAGTATMAAEQAQKAKNWSKVDLGFTTPKERSTFSMENKNELVTRLTKLLNKIGTMTLIVYRDESEDPKDAKLWIDDIKKNI